MGIGSHRRGVRLYRECSDGEKHSGHIARGRELEQLWAQGLSLRQIAAHFGWQGPTAAGAVIATFRAEGYELPYRRRPEAVENIRAGVHRRFADRQAA
jgi:hypothetical protein